VTALRGPQSEIADIARQARELLGLVRESRWPGFEPAAPRSAPRPPEVPVRKTAGPTRPTAAPTPALREEPCPWSSLEEITLAVSTCTKCPLHATRTQTVPGEGSATARLLFVGEAPGAEEDRLGRPFVGAAGQLLDKMIGAMGLARDRVFIANVLKCRPPGNRDPLEHEVAACIPYLRGQIALIKPEVICSLGRHASHALLERKDSLGKLRGRFFEYRGTPLMPTFHPSYLLRTPADKNSAWKDLQQVMKRLGLPLPEQHPPTEENNR